ncbi:MAG: GSCFA domain-containing protein [Alistipes sp.]|nr:GSCFA domain-containing protein [Alistipes sp.]
MQLYTKTQITPFNEKIDHTTPIFSIGSCFANNIAERLAGAKFKVCASPTGILFNPESIALTLERLGSLLAGDSKALPTIDELLYDNGAWFHYDFHSSFSRPSAEETLQQIHAAITDGANSLQEAKVVIITFGTAMTYRHIESGRIVANCHKQPQRLFNRQMMGVEEIADRYVKLCNGLLKGKRVIFTVSPIRHLSDGLETNSLSKATLRVSLSLVAQRCDNVVYFPSFEIMNDELRDYRFYADDMAHPTPLAINYIWERFTESAMSAETQQLITRIGQITTAAAHRPFNPESEQHKLFCHKLMEQIDALQTKHPQLDFSEEKGYFSRYL